MCRRSIIQFLIVTLLVVVISACSSTSIGVQRGEEPASDSESSDILVEPIPSPTNYPKGQVTFKITRTGELHERVQGGDIEVSGEIPIDIFISQDGRIDTDIIYSTGEGVGITSWFGEGTVGQGQLIGTWKVRYEVLGVFTPAPACSLELTVNEVWEELVEATVIVAGQAVNVPEQDSFIIWTNTDHQFGNIKFEQGKTRIVEDYLTSDVDWQNTYEITGLSLPDFTGCSTDSP